MDRERNNHGKESRRRKEDFVRRNIAYDRLDGIWKILADAKKAKQVEKIGEKIDQLAKPSLVDTIIKWVSFVVTVLGVVFSTGALIMSAVQIRQASDSYNASVEQFRESIRQFEQSGPQYSFFYADITPGGKLDLGGGKLEIGGQTSIGLVVSNTGRTADSVVSLRRNTKRKETLTVCIPEFDQDGDLVDQNPATLDTAMIRLEPGESRLVFLTGQSENYVYEGGGSFRSEGFELVDDIMVYGASGIEREAEYKKDVPDQVREYYTTLPGYEQARSICGGLVDDGSL